MDIKSHGFQLQIVTTSNQDPLIWHRFFPLWVAFSSSFSCPKHCSLQKHTHPSSVLTSGSTSPVCSVVSSGSKIHVEWLVRSDLAHWCISSLPKPFHQDLENKDVIDGHVTVMELINMMSHHWCADIASFQTCLILTLELHVQAFSESCIVYNESINCGSWRLSKLYMLQLKSSHNCVPINMK